MSLRDDLIEAGAFSVGGVRASFKDVGHGLKAKTWVVSEMDSEIAEACLDAFLDTLADRADEWTEPLDWVEVKKLIAVLRGEE